MVGAGALVAEEVLVGADVLLLGTADVVADVAVVEVAVVAEPPDEFSEPHAVRARAVARVRVTRVRVLGEVRARIPL